MDCNFGELCYIGIDSNFIGLCYSIMDYNFGELCYSGMDGSCYSGMGYFYLVLSLNMV